MSQPRHNKPTRTRQQPACTPRTLGTVCHRNDTFDTLLNHPVYGWFERNDETN